MELAAQKQLWNEAAATLEATCKVGSHAVSLMNPQGLRVRTRSSCLYSAAGVQEKESAAGV